MENETKKIGLALGSGGSKGLVHIGIIKAMERENIPIDIIAGSSIGSFIGALYAAHKDIGLIEDLALNNFSKWSGITLFDFTGRGGVIKGRKIERMMGGWLKGVGFGKLKIPFGAVATDLDTGEEVDLLSGDLVHAVRASASIPSFFQPVKIGDRWLIDGALSNPVPDDLAKRMGADTVISINLDSNKFNGKNSDKKMSLTKVSTRSFSIMRFHLARYSITNTDILIEPDLGEMRGLVGWKQLFNRRDVMKLIEIGEQSVAKVLPEIGKIINR